MKRALNIYKTTLADVTWKKQRAHIARMADLMDDFEKEIEAYRSADEVAHPDDASAKKDAESHKLMDKAFDHFAPLFDLVQDAYRASK